MGLSTSFGTKRSEHFGVAGDQHILLGCFDRRRECSDDSINDISLYGHFVYGGKERCDRFGRDFNKMVRVKNNGEVTLCYYK